MWFDDGPPIDRVALTVTIRGRQSHPDVGSLTTCSARLLRLVGPDSPTETQDGVDDLNERWPCIHNDSVAWGVFSRPV